MSCSGGDRTARGDFYLPIFITGESAGITRPRSIHSCSCMVVTFEKQGLERQQYLCHRVSVGWYRLLCSWNFPIQILIILQAVASPTSRNYLQCLQGTNTKSRTQLVWVKSHNMHVHVQILGPQRPHDAPNKDLQHRMVLFSLGCKELSPWQHLLQQGARPPINPALSPAWPSAHAST